MNVFTLVSAFISSPSIITTHQGFQLSTAQISAKTWKPTCLWLPSTPGVAKESPGIKAVALDSPLRTVDEQGHAAREWLFGRMFQLPQIFEGSSSIH